MRRRCAATAAGLAAAMIGSVARAAGSGGAELPGADLGWLWVLPFALLLLAIATGPLLAPRFWHGHYGKVAGALGLAVALALCARFGADAAIAATAHALLAEYLSFIVLLFALYTVAGGLLVTGNVHGTPATNTATLALGTLLASVVGTTGASMILIRPLIRANDERAFNVHVVVFFIFLVGNVGGALTPLGDPPLFMGFLRGVDFFWTTRHLLLPTAGLVVVLLAMFYALDSWLTRGEGRYLEARDATPPTRFGLSGRINLLLIAGIVAAILLSAEWRPGVVVPILGTGLALQNIVRDGLLLGMGGLSIWLTPDEHRRENGFTWGPILEVALLFAAIFVAIIPVLAILRAGTEGAFGGLMGLVTGQNGEPSPAAFFWLTGGLSALLDNAPTYLVFFELAGGDPQTLMGPLARTLAAISMGAVYMGALTYIGNAPNFMVYAIAIDRGVRMPSFFGYMLWSCGLLLPLFLILGLLAF